MPSPIQTPDSLPAGSINANSIPASIAAERAQVLAPALLAIVLGTFLVLATGFAAPEAVHNAAHDTRHSFSFPCH